MALYCLQDYLTIYQQNSYVRTLLTEISTDSNLRNILISVKGSDLAHVEMQFTTWASARQNQH